MNKMFRVLEIVWLLIGITGVCSTIYAFVKQDFKGAIYFLIFTLIASVMYFVRRKQRINVNKS